MPNFIVGEKMKSTVEMLLVEKMMTILSSELNAYF